MLRMDYKVYFKVNEKIYKRDPESTELGKEIVKSSIDLIYELGFENFTFKKLANYIHTTEASIYRYFENKHRLLLYILNWYWSYISYVLTIQFNKQTNSKSKLKFIIKLLTHELPESRNKLDYNKNYLNQIVISESSKVYLVKEVNEINKNEVFKPYKELCGQIANVINEYNPNYKYPHSLSTTLIEAAHQQQYFIKNLPRLTDAKAKNKNEFTAKFLDDLLFKVLDIK
jgi:AcrR family transcriptional regulator